MSNQVGLFFKELNSNEYVKNIMNSDDTEENLISKLLESEELILKLKTFVEDDKFIKDKIETFVKQVLKKKQKPVEKIKDTDLPSQPEKSTNLTVNKSNHCKCNPCECNPCECNPCECDLCESTVNDFSDNIYLSKYNKEQDLKNNKVSWIAESIRLEHVDHLIKMTTVNFEVFY